MLCPKTQTQTQKEEKKKKKTSRRCGGNSQQDGKNPSPLMRVQEPSYAYPSSQQLPRSSSDRSSGSGGGGGGVRSEESARGVLVGSLKQNYLINKTRARNALL